MSKENVELIQRGFEHFMATGEPYWEAFDEEVEVHDHDTMDQGEYRGHAGLGRWLEDWSAAWSEFSMEPEESLDVGEQVVMFVRMKATGVSSGVIDRFWSGSYARAGYLKTLIRRRARILTATFRLWNRSVPRILCIA
jgi:hypothetical protein